MEACVVTGDSSESRGKGSSERLANRSPLSAECKTSDSRRPALSPGIGFFILRSDPVWLQARHHPPPGPSHMWRTSPVGTGELEILVKEAGDSGPITHTLCASVPSSVNWRNNNSFKGLSVLTKGQTTPGRGSGTKLKVSSAPFRPYQGQGPPLHAELCKSRYK